MLWTYAKVADSNAGVPLAWQVASDSSFTTIVSSSQVDATGLTAASVKGGYVFADTVKSWTYQAGSGKTITVASSGAVTYA